MKAKFQKKCFSFVFKPTGWQVKLILALLVVAGATLYILGYIDPAIAYLDSERLTFHIGYYEVSVYGILQRLGLIILTLWLTHFVSVFIDSRLRKLRVRAGNRALIAKAVQILLYCIAFLVVLRILNLNLSALAIFGGALGIGIGFGLQKIASNFISGLILLFESSVEEGAMIELPDGTAGYVRYIGARYTLIEQFDSKEVMVPNEEFITTRVINWTYSNNQSRAEVLVGVSYGSDLDQVRELLLAAAKEHPMCSLAPEPRCYLTEFGDSSVNFRLLFWVEDVRKGRLQPRSDVMFSIWNKFKEHNIQIPFPQRDIHIIRDKDGSVDE
ncbi:MAG: mechanosensitive ion channel protein MscS [Verrucomicrobia bacterium CG_4_10_14_3_um_filter_43_23]|nr:MAG: hypothetical protein AUJ82_06505 [Verrucomicrobia bacterium CG1_02_43_26]PIP58880.1 MAG: mechanosensitive ion channel protein MscS [Verrucomicrobia bacterium CG22_combo_CG10-13_8_21_14_all_43_17]PIX57878.1 MAG: mechanosensitive ion channel protein MscS [Verrucomicrobia bacterium CG_4_10_14_3_um_filter_43_23]PIY60971.1 MAG: mechanosensitive ion channel protein MscS [Verrucomicrobia bacterium CG_4_10_14_0_8_um_filter_43_34]PJA43465.1 MAG: mechanosensitive ion channel protein MscS [Verruco